MFWDSSAIVPLLVPEASSTELTTAMKGDDAPAVWWATSVECESAVRRRHRAAPMTQDQLRQIAVRFRAAERHLDTVAPSEDVRRLARRLVSRHPLRAADALQLAAALVWCEGQPDGDVFVSLDERLRDAARAEGFLLRP